MNIKVLGLIIGIIITANYTYSRGSNVPLPAVYDVMQSNDTSQINAVLADLEKSSAKEKDAYKGTLLMKKSGMMKTGMEKLNVFKQGRKLLEGSIKQDSSNTEYRFLRLMIQENVPDFLNYHQKKEEDAKMIREGYSKLPENLRQVIKKYSKNSHILKPEDFQK
jgi:hypothetical protein